MERVNKFKLVLFDLDHTLWDYETNSSQTLKEIFTSYELGKHRIEFSDFKNKFDEINEFLWHEYDHQRITQKDIRNIRFQKVLSHFKHPKPSLSAEMNDFFVKEGPKKTNLFEGAIEILDYLHKKYPLILVTNGFNDIQDQKVDGSGLRKYFLDMVTSEKAGAPKPSPLIFNMALEIGKSNAHETVMIGDNPLSDIGGAKNLGISTIHFKPHHTFQEIQGNWKIGKLKELRMIL